MKNVQTYVLVYILLLPILLLSGCSADNRSIDHHMPVEVTLFLSESNMADWDKIKQDFETAAESNINDPVTAFRAFEQICTENYELIDSHYSYYSKFYRFYVSLIYTRNQDKIFTSIRQLYEEDDYFNGAYYIADLVPRSRLQELLPLLPYDSVWIKSFIRYNREDMAAEFIHNVITKPAGLNFYFAGIYYAALSLGYHNELLNIDPSHFDMNPYALYEVFQCLDLEPEELDRFIVHQINGIESPDDLFLAIKQYHQGKEL